MERIQRLARQRSNRKLRPPLGFAQVGAGLVWAVALLAPSPPAAAQATSAGTAIDTVLLATDARVLAHDSLGGRATGSPGAARAAAYIAARLEAMGLQPAGRRFLHSVPLRETRIAPSSRLVVRSAADSAVFLPGRDFHVANGAASAFRSFRGPAIFAGTAANAAAALANTNVSGAAIVLASALGDGADSLLSPWVRAGIAAVILLVGDDESLEAMGGSLGSNRLFVDAPVDDMAWQAPVPTLIAGPRVVRALLEGTAIPQTAFEGQPFRAVALPREIDARIDASPTVAVPGDNVLAVITGSDPQLRDDIVLYTAHYDHLGIGRPDERGDSIYNGFSDNAAGVAMLLAIADAMRRNPPATSVAFAFLTGEERGLLGASYLAANSPWPLARIRAVINLDGGAPPRPPVSWRIAGALDTPIGALAQQLGASHGWAVQLSAARPNSDYWPFHKRGVPSAFIIPGNDWEQTSGAERDALRARWNRYHEPGDEWHPDYPMAGLARYAAFALELGRAIAESSR